MTGGASGQDSVDVDGGRVVNLQSASVLLQVILGHVVAREGRVLFIEGLNGLLGGDQLDARQGLLVTLVACRGLLSMKAFIISLASCEAKAHRLRGRRLKDA